MCTFGRILAKNSLLVSAQSSRNKNKNKVKTPDVTRHDLDNNGGRVGKVLD